MKAQKWKYKSELIVFSSIVLLYLLITTIFYTKTTIFYDTYDTYNVLLDTDTGVLFNWNTFAVSQDNSKHILFSAIVSILAYPIYIISKILTKFGFEYKHIYGFGLITLQILVSASCVTMLHNYIKTFNIKRTTLLLITVLMIVSFPQIFMSVNVERFIYTQLSLIFFIFILTKLKNQDSYLIDIAAIPLFGITLTNGYIYIINLILEFKTNIRKILKHLGFFSLASYIVLVVTKSYKSFFLVGEIIQSDAKFLTVMPLIEKLKMVILRLIYPILYFPGYEIVNNKLNQNGAVNKIFLILVMLVVIGSIIGWIRNKNEKIPQICLGVLIVNLILHGIIGYNLESANIMTIHFSFAIIILLAYLAKTLDIRQTKRFNIFLTIVIATVVISNMQGFAEILRLGISVYPK